MTIRADDIIITLCKICSKIIVNGKPCIVVYPIKIIWPPKTHEHKGTKTMSLTEYLNGSTKHL